MLERSSQKRAAVGGVPFIGAKVAEHPLRGHATGNGGVHPGSVGMLLEQSREPCGIHQGRPYRAGRVKHCRVWPEKAEGDSSSWL